MEYGRYVGRVGALAVALGIGVAVANGGVAPNADGSCGRGLSQRPSRVGRSSAESMASAQNTTAR